MGLFYHNQGKNMEHSRGIASGLLLAVSDGTHSMIPITLKG